MTKAASKMKTTLLAFFLSLSSVFGQSFFDLRYSTRDHRLAVWSTLVSAYNVSQLIDNARNEKQFVEIRIACAARLLREYRKSQIALDAAFSTANLQMQSGIDEGDSRDDPKRQFPVFGEASKYADLMPLMVKMAVDAQISEYLATSVLSSYQSDSLDVVSEIRSHYNKTENSETRARCERLIILMDN